MTGRIRRLPPGLVDRIAAGEVVERPASVVKELVENALDAGATRVDVEVRAGGRDLVAVRDDGIGMGPEDLRLAFESHATSKLSAMEDLDHIASFGFRGEALASMGAVADCRILSRERGAAEAHEVESSGGRVSPVRPAAAPEGTLVEVRNLFRHVPARRKFLRAPGTELSHVSAALHRAALANPEVGFSLVRDGSVVFRVGPEQDRRERIARFFGRELAAALLPVGGQEGRASISGFAARPDAARATAGAEHLFLNGRPVRDRTLVHAVRRAYDGLLTRGRHPVVFLFLAIDPGEVDVNVHPAKLEVRFRDAEVVHRLVHGAVREALLAADLRPDAVPGAAAERMEGIADALAGFLVRANAVSEAAPAPSSGSPSNGSTSNGWNRPAPYARPAAPPAAALAAVRHVGRYLQVADTFLVFETDDGLAVVDQHALHERILLEEISGRVRGGALEVQRFLAPQVVELPAADVELLLAETELLARIGVEVGRFGDAAVAVHALPAMIAARDPRPTVAALVERLREGRCAGREKLLETVLHSMACRAAVMAGDRLTEAQAAELMRRADLIDTAAGCAHGRPTALRLTFRDLRRHFRR